MLRITGISLVLALVIGGSGCGGGYSASQTPEPAPTPTPSSGSVSHQRNLAQLFVECIRLRGERVRIRLARQSQP
jgi:hypothetical protein